MSRKSQHEADEVNARDAESESVAQGVQKAADPAARHTGKFVSQDGSSLTHLCDKSGKNETTSLASGCTVSLNSKPSSLDALRAGDKVSLRGDPATNVAATR